MTHPTDALRLVPVSVLPDEIDLFRIISRAGRSNREKALAVSVYLEALSAAPASPLPEGGGLLGAEHLQAAITRLTGLVAGDEIEAVYADFTFPGHTFRADVRALLSALPAAPTGAK